MTNRIAIRSAPTLASALLLGLLLAACEYRPGGAKQDSATAPGVAPAGAGTDSITGVPAVPPDSSWRAGAADTGSMQLSPASPRRGGVIFAHVEGIAADARCTWKGAALPCHRRPGGGVIALIPLPADEPAGTYSFTVEHPGGRIARQLTIADRQFGRELVMLNRDLYALVSRTADVSRDARALRGVLGTQTAERRWSGDWRDPIAGASRESGYGTERFYVQASDSSRAVTLEPSLTTRGAFAADTSTGAPSGGVPSWRHAGVDVAARRGASVAAPAAGTVVDVGEYTLTGRTLVLDHGQGVLSAYFHLDTVLVRRGDQVARGRSVARVGSTGLSTGPHLHYGVYVNGKDVDPAAWHAMPAWLKTDSTRTTAMIER